jgi:hypothetical protein
MLSFCLLIFLSPSLGVSPPLYLFHNALLLSSDLPVSQPRRISCALPLFPDTLLLSPDLPVSSLRRVSSSLPVTPIFSFCLLIFLSLSTECPLLSPCSPIPAPVFLSSCLLAPKNILLSSSYPNILFQSSNLLCPSPRILIHISLS